MMYDSMTMTLKNCMTNQRILTLISLKDNIVTMGDYKALALEFDGINSKYN